MNNFAPMKNCPGVQGNLNRMPGYKSLNKTLHLHVCTDYSKTVMVNVFNHVRL